jgi:Tfp pilus assembly protein PilF
MFKKSLEADPEFVESLGNYALFLETIRTDRVAAEKIYKKALKIAPNDKRLKELYEEFKQNKP